MMTAAQRDRELIADFAAERAGLGKSEMVGIGWFAAADKARLLHDISEVLPVAIAARSSNRQDAFVDALRLSLIGGCAGGDHLRPGNERHPRPNRSRMQPNRMAAPKGGVQRPLPRAPIAHPSPQQGQLPPTWLQRTNVWRGVTS